MPVRRRLVGSLTAATMLALTVGLPVPARAEPTTSQPSKPPLTRTVAVGSKPYDVAISQNLGKAFVVDEGAVSTVSLLTQRVLGKFTTLGVHGQNAIALMRGSTEGYITNYDKDLVVVFDTETEEILRYITVGKGAVDVAKVNTPVGQRAYVAFSNDNKLVSIRPETGKVVQTVKLPHGSQTLTSGPGGKTVWAGSSYDGHVYVVNAATGKMTKSINVSRSGPVTSIAFAPGNKKAWIAGLGGISVVDTKTGKTLKFVSITKLFSADGPNMGSVALTGSGRYALVENSTFPDVPQTGEIAMLDTKTYKVVTRIATGVEPEALAIDTKRNVAYVPNYADNTVTYFTVPR